jgi:quinol-cytochrome oxidoreductase complex cytochrome b subunit/coenzyme F420-reducing hydrogenase delta subunit
MPEGRSLDMPLERATRTDTAADTVEPPALGRHAGPLHRALRALFDRPEGWLDRVFPPAWNPLYHLGALGFFYYWVVTVSGIYVYVLFDTSVAGAYGSVEAMTAQWYAGGVMRSLHRYASDAMVLMMAIHIVREFALDRYRGPRWFTWITGLPLVGLVLGAGITGYWLVWDRLAQYVAIMTSEWLDWLPIFGRPIARNFLTPDSLSDRFFTLLLFIHIALPIMLLFILWIHLQRVSRPKINPARGLAVGSFVMMLALALVKPATSQGAADLATVPAVVGLDWFFLGLSPLLKIWSNAATWSLAGVVSVILIALPWLPPMRRAKPAAVDLDNCNGCGRCVADCPYNAVMLAPRSDGRGFTHEAVVNPGLCVSCGICMGACPSSTPFRRIADLRTGIDLPDFPLKEVRERVERASRGLVGRDRVMIFGCDHALRVTSLRTPGRGAISLPCIAMLPPSVIDYVLSRDLADGVVLTGCRAEACFNRFGVRWTEDRVAQRRDPYLRGRVPRERILLHWAAPADRAAFVHAVGAFAARLAGLGPSIEPGPAAAAAAGPGEEVVRG